MNLADVALLATVGATRIYTTSKTGSVRVTVASATVDNRNSLYISVVPEGEEPTIHNVRRVLAFSLSLPTEGA